MPPLARAPAIQISLRPGGGALQRARGALFKATGGAGLYTDLPFGRILADITAGRQHVSNQYELIGRNWAARMFGATEESRI